MLESKPTTAKITIEYNGLTRSFSCKEFECKIDHKFKLGNCKYGDKEIHITGTIEESLYSINVQKEQEKLNKDDRFDLLDFG